MTEERNVLTRLTIIWWLRDPTSRFWCIFLLLFFPIKSASKLDLSTLLLIVTCHIAFKHQLVTLIPSLGHVASSPILCFSDVDQFLATQLLRESLRLLILQYAGLISAVVGVYVDVKAVTQVSGLRIQEHDNYLPPDYICSFLHVIAHIPQENWMDDIIGTRQISLLSRSGFTLWSVYYYTWWYSWTFKCKRVK